MHAINGIVHRPLAEAAQACKLAIQTLPGYPVLRFKTMCNLHVIATVPQCIALPKWAWQPAMEGRGIDIMHLTLPNSRPCCMQSLCYSLAL